MKKLTLLFLVVSAALTGRAQDPWISLFDQSPFDLRGTAATETVSIRVRLDSGMLLKNVRLSEHPSLVRLNGQCRQGYIDGLRIARADGPMPVLRLTVITDSLPESGSYLAIFSFTDPNNHKHARVDINLTLNRLAVKLDTVHRMAIHIEGNEIRYDPLLIRETGRQCDIPSLVIGPQYMPGIKDGDFIQFHPKPGPVAAGSMIAIPYELSPEYRRHPREVPLGTTTGWVEVSAPGLSNNLSVPIDIINKRSKWWIVLATFLGILVGALVRNVIRSRLLAAQTRTNGFALIQRIQAETNKITDTEFKEKISGLIATLNATLLDRSAQQSDLDTALKTATDNYNSEKTSFESTLTKTGDDLKTLTAALNNTRLSAFVTRQLTPVRTDAGQAAAALQLFDPTNAAARIQDAITHINELIRHYGAQTRDLRNQLTTDDFYPVLVPTDSANADKADAKKIQDSVQSIKNDNTDVKTATAAIAQLDKAQASLEELLDNIQAAATTAFNAIFRSDSQDARMTALVNAFDAWDNRLEALIRDPAQTMDLNLVGALNNASAAIGPPVPGLRNTRGGGAAPSVAFRATPSFIASVMSGDLVPIIAFHQPVAGMATIDRLAKQSRKRLFWLNVGQIGVLSVVLSLIFYKTYGPNFVGTMDEMINLFLLGFSLDVTIDGVTKLIGKP
ncbi:MAG TPA: hypothetical protein VFE32_04570 [Puia sp.]|jgi:hypothetical protein|nr:hypothetical protein [Puia sp.]